MMIVIRAHEKEEKKKKENKRRKKKRKKGRKKKRSLRRVHDYPNKVASGTPRSPNRSPASAAICRMRDIQQFIY